MIIKIMHWCSLLIKQFIYLNTSQEYNESCQMYWKYVAIKDLPENKDSGETYELRA
jgi:hypothetical protein